MDVPEARFLIQLIDYIINEKDNCPVLPNNFNEELFITLTGMHEVDSIVYYALKKSGIKLREESMKKLSDMHFKSVLRYAANSAELDYMKTVFDKKCVEYVLLKGAVLRELYPTPDMRTSCDVDFLCRREDAKKIEDIMVGSGFEVDNYDDGVDCYKKKPFVCFEMHKRLLPGHDRFDCFDGVDKRFENLEGTKYGKKLGLEDTYLYMITHTAKHFFAGGSGIRPIIDLYLFLSKYGGSLDSKFIDERLDSVKLKKFNDEMVVLSKYWFSEEKSSPLTAKLSVFVVFSGIFGTKDNADAQEIAYKNHNSVVNKRVSVFSKVFLSYNNMCLRYKYLKKAPVLLPVAYVQRIVTAIFDKNKRIKLGEELSQNRPVSQSKIDDMEDLINELQIF